MIHYLTFWKKLVITVVTVIKELKDHEFYVSLVFMEDILYKMKSVTLQFQEIDRDAQHAVNSMILMNTEFKHIRNEEEEVNRLIEVSIKNARKYNVEPFYEFEKKY